MKMMKWMTAAVLAITAMAAPRTVRADADPDDDPDVKVLNRAAYDTSNDASQGWTADLKEHGKKCLAAYDKLHARGMADSTTTMMHTPLGKLPTGKQTIRDVRDACEQVMKEVGLQDVEQQLGNVVASLLQDVKGLDDSTVNDFTQIDSSIKACNDAVDAAHAAGVPDDYVLDVKSNGESYAWQGTLGTMKKEVCDRGDVARKKAIEKLEAPYLKVGMKNDKLKMILDNAGATYFQIAGGETTLDASKLLKSKVWFKGFSGGGGSCSSGEPGYLTRYEFDGNQNLVKTTNKNTCGTPPKSAYR